MRKFILLSLLSLAIAPIAEAAPIAVNCPDSAATDDREFTLTTDPAASTCYDFGDDANELNANGFDVMFLSGWTIIDKDDAPSTDNDNGFFVDGLGATSGSFLIDPSLWTMFDQIAIGFVVGGGQIDPKWAVFLLPEGETSGLWSNSPRQGGGLSHGNLYGFGDGNTITEVPEPATLLLLGSGLTFAVRRRRAKR